MRAALRAVLPALIALALAGCGGEAPSTGAPSPAAGAANAPASSAAPGETAAPPDAAALDTASLRERASASLAANRLYSPAGDNAVEDYLSLRDRVPGDAGIETALVDLAPYVMIGAEQATVAEDFVEAQRLVALLARIDAEAPAVPRLREALLAAETAATLREAEALANAEAQAQADAARLAAEAQRAEAARREATQRSAGLPARPAPAAASARAPATPTRPVASRPAPSAGTANPVAANPAPAAAPSSARALIQRVPPRFPEAAARRRLEGSVEVRVSIAADGRVENVDVMRADPPGVFDREAVLAVRRWRYAPADAPSEARVVLAFKRP